MSLPDNLHTDRQALESWKLICRIASFVKTGEVDDDGHIFDMSHEDAFDTLHRIISDARSIYRMED